jgi:type VI secretion system protein ImpA
MASPEVLDFAKLLSPIPGGPPAGVDLRTDPSPASAYYAIKDARSAARAAERQMVVGDGEATDNLPDWRPVLEHATKALAEKTKDLEIAAYLIEALGRQHGFAGLRDGFRLARELIERYWDGLYPLPDEEGIETRVAPLTGLNGVDADGTLIVPITLVPITESTSFGRLGSVHYQQATALGKITDPKVREKRIAQGAISLDVFQKAVGESSPAFYSRLVQDLTQCQDEYLKLSAELEKRCSGHAPPSSNIKAALASCSDIVKSAAKHKLDSAPTKAADGAPGAGPAASAAPAPGQASDAIQTREDAFRALLKVAEFFRRTEPQAVVSYALEQVVRWGRMPLPELLTELIPEDAPRKNLFKQVGITPEPTSDAKKK